MYNLPPVRITDKDAQDFKELYQKQFGVELTDAEAREQATKPARLVQFTQWDFPSEVTFLF